MALGMTTTRHPGTLVSHSRLNLSLASGDISCGVM